MSNLQDDIQSYITARFDKLDRAAAEIKVSAIEMVVCAHTLGQEPLYSIVLDRVIAGYTETPADKLTEVVKRIVAEEVVRANAE